MSEPTTWRMFLGVAVFMTVIGVVYWFASYEPAGTTMLALAAALAAMCGVYLRVTADGARGTDAGHEHEHEPEHYLPESSVWPFGVGVGALLATTGMIVGFGYAHPGLVLLDGAIGGLAAQSRRRA